MFSHFSFRIVAAASIVCLVLGSCRENTIINTNVNPAVDNIHTFQLPDTITFYTKTVMDDSQITSLSNTGFYIIHGLGSVAHDPFAGGTNAEIYMQIVPPSVSYSFPDSAIIDSAVLILPYTGFTWGDTSLGAAPQTVSVYPLADSLSIDSVYYAKQRKAVDFGRLYASKSIDFAHLKDSVSLGDTMYAPHLHMRLDENGFFTSDLVAGLAGDSSVSAFLSLFKGLYLTVDTNTGSAIPYFRLDGTSDVYGHANVLVYYHTPSTDSQTASFPFSSSVAAHYNAISHNYSGTPAAALLSSTAQTDNIVMAQNGPGASIDIRFPYLKNLPQNIIINKAQLTITMIDTMQSGTYFGPARIFPKGVTDSATLYSIADQFPLSLSDGANFIDGNIRTIEMAGFSIRQYVINFPVELQHAIAASASELHLRIGGTATYPGAYRLVAGGRTNSNAGMTLDVVYSKQ